MCSSVCLEIRLNNNVPGEIDISRFFIRVELETIELDRDDKVLRHTHR